MTAEERIEHEYQEVLLKRKKAETSDVAVNVAIKIIKMFGSKAGMPKDFVQSILIDKEPKNNLKVMASENENPFAYWLEPIGCSEELKKLVEQVNQTILEIPDKERVLEYLKKYCDCKKSGENKVIITLKEN